MKANQLAIEPHRGAAGGQTKDGVLAFTVFSPYERLDLTGQMPYRFLAGGMNLGWDTGARKKVGCHNFSGQMACLGLGIYGGKTGMASGRTLGFGPFPFLSFNHVKD